MLFVIHALDRRDGISTRAKFYRAHRIHLDQAERYNVDVVTAGTLVADDGETPVGSIFVIDAKDRNAVDTFARSDPTSRTPFGRPCKSTPITRSAAPRSSRTAAESELPAASSTVNNFSIRIHSRELVINCYLSQ